MATLVRKARKDMDTLGFIFENYATPYQDTQNCLQKGWHRSGKTQNWTKLSLLLVFDYLLLNGIKKNPKSWLIILVFLGLKIPMYVLRPSDQSSVGSYFD